MILNNPAERPFSDVFHFGIAITEPRKGSFHVGALYKIEAEGPYICHLAFHHLLRPRDIPTPEYCWLQGSYDEPNLRVLAFAFAGISESLKIPYSILYQGCYFEEGTLRYIRNGPGEGLTCSTFIMAIFEALELPLMIIETWAERPEDEIWREQMLAMLAQRAPQEHVEAQMGSLGSPRFRPEEVAAAAASVEHPINFETAIALGAQIIAAMPRHPATQAPSSSALGS